MPPPIVTLYAVYTPPPDWTTPTQIQTRPSVWIEDYSPAGRAALRNVRQQIANLHKAAKSKKKRRAYRDALEIIDAHLGELG
jgi:hypothetical protein